MTRGAPIPGAVTLHVPFRIVKRGGRKEMQMPSGEPAPRARFDNTMIKAMARAFRWQRLLDSGEFATIADLAEHERIAAPYLTRLLRLTQLSPEIVEAILEGRQPPDLTLESLRAQFPMDWSSQRAFLIVSNGDRARYGSITSAWEHFNEWKRLDEGDEGSVDAERLLNGMLAHDRLLDLVENFILFDESKAGAARKVVARNHQVLGVNRAVASVARQEAIKAEIPPGERLRHRLVELPLERKAPAKRRKGDQALVTAETVLPSFTREFQARAAEELALLSEGSAIAEMLSDYAVMRDQARGCFR